MSGPWPGTAYLPPLPPGTTYANTSSNTAPPTPQPYTTSGIPGPPGPQGPPGPAQAAGYLASSSSTLSLQTGVSPNITTQSNLAYQPGARIRLSYSGDPTGQTYLEGTVTAYNIGTGAMTVHTDTAVGTGGPYSAWNINLAGNQGTQGPVGPAGPQGIPGQFTIQDPPPPASPVPGQIWWDSSTGQAYIWYVDTAGGQWVVVNQQGPQGPQGATGPQGPAGPSGLVTMAGTPPPSPSAGAFWWNTNDGSGQLFIYYNDGTSSQWVLANSTPPAPSWQVGSGLTLNQGTSPATIQVAQPYQPLVGVVDGSGAAAGQVGEFLTVNGGGSLANAAWTTCSTLNLSAGDWDLWGNCTVTNSASAGSYLAGGIGTATNTAPGLVSDFISGQATFGGWGSPIAPIRVSITASTPYYGLAYCAFTSGTASGNVLLAARRRR